MRRRDLLAGALSAAALGALPWRAARAAPYAAAPDRTAAGLLLPKGTRAERVLEIFLYGGLGPFESFYVVEEHGRTDADTYPREQWHLFERLHKRVFTTRCGLGEEDTWLTPFAKDARGLQVSLGPLTQPLKARADLLKRLRVLVQRHSLEPHEAAIPQGLTGMRLGSPRMAGLGTAVQRAFLDRDTDNRSVPFSFVLYPEGEISTDNIRAASALGLHPGACRPLELRVAPDADLTTRLQRAVAGDTRAERDALVAYYAAQARARYTGDGALLRSRALDDTTYALRALSHAPEMAELFPADILQGTSGRSCQQSAEFAATTTSLQLAAHLLTHPTAPARHVTVIDGGLVTASGGGGYDAHTEHLTTMATNLPATLQALADLIREPGDDDPTKIDLDTTLVVLNTEFGRTPFPQDGSGGTGTNHHPYGYVTALLGGPIREAQAGVLGAIDADGWADRYITPVENRAAILAAMGLYPFTPDGFTIGDIRGVNKEHDGLAWLNEVVLGQGRSS